MISPTGSGKSLTFHIAPFAIDFFKHGERDNIQTVCLVIFPLVLLMNDQVSSLRRWKRNQGCCCGSWQFRNWKQGSLREQIQPCVHKPRSFNLFGSHRSTILTLKNKIEAVFIDEGQCVAKWLVFYSFHLYIVRKLSVILLFVQPLFFCLKFAFVVFHGFLADISQLYTCKDWSSAVLCKSNESEILWNSYSSLRQRGGNFERFKKQRLRKFAEDLNYPIIQELLILRTTRPWRHSSNFPPTICKLNSSPCRRDKSSPRDFVARCFSHNKTSIKRRLGASLDLEPRQ